MGRLLRLGGHLGDRPMGHARGGRHGHRAHPPRHDAHAGAAAPPVGARRPDHDRRPALERAGHPLGRARRRGRVRAAILDLRGRPRPQGARRAARRGPRDAAARSGRGEPFYYEGEHYHAKRTDTMLPPAIVQQPRIPTWVVGVWPRPKSMRRVARYDGWIPNYAPPGAAGMDPLEQQRTYTPEIAAEAIAWIASERERLGLADRPVRRRAGGHHGRRRRVADAAVVRPWADAGVTWWLEADWYVPGRAGRGVRARPPACGSAAAVASSCRQARLDA